jgi:hypothetical protein
MSPGLPVNRAKFPYCVACGHHFIDHPSSNETAQGVNDEMQRVYLETMANMAAWSANKKTLPQPMCPETGKLLSKVSLPEFVNSLSAMDGRDRPLKN